MSSILKVDELQDTSGNLIIKEDSNTITVGASGDTITIPSGATLDGSNATLSGFATTNGITMADQWRVTTEFTGNAEPITSNWERNDTAPSLSYFGSQMTESSGVFTFPSTGIYYVTFNANFKLNGDSRYNSANIFGCTDGSTMNQLFECNTHITRNGSSTTYALGMSHGIIDVTNTSNVKVDFRVAHQNTSTETLANTGRDVTYVRFIRLGDT